MNHRAMQQQNALSASEEMRAPLAVADRKPPVFCPKPRRLSPLAAVAEPVLPFRRGGPPWHISRKGEVFRRPPYLLVRVFFGSRRSNPNGFRFQGGEQNQVSSSPPFFCGSPPSRAANPVVHDARFGDDRPPAAFTPVPLIQSGPPLSPKQGCAHAKFGLMPAAVRIEGFDCLNRDRRSCSSITAVA
ncbi:unnamed protein product [Musa acuminata var. zebrina]